MSDAKISALTSYTTPLNADLVPVVDTANTTTKQVSWANIKATLKSYFDTLYPSGSGSSTGTNTGDNSVNTLYSGLVSNATHTGDATGATALTVVRINGTSLAGLATGILKNTTTTGVPSIAINSDLPVMSATVGGAVPTPPNNTTTFLRGDGTFATPAGSGDMVLANAQTNSALKTFLNGTFGLRNVANTITSFFSNAATVARTYTLQDRDGTLADNTDLALKANLASPTFTGTVILPSGQALIAPVLGTPTSATLTNATGLPIAGLVASTTQAIGVGSVELGHATDTTIARSGAGTITVEGIRVRTTTPLVVSTTSYTTNTGTSLNMDNLDEFIITAQAGALLFNAPGGTLVQGRSLIIRIKDNATARALTWDAIFRAVGVALPTTTVLSKTLYLGFKYNSTDTKWDLIASAQEA